MQLVANQALTSYINTSFPWALSRSCNLHHFLCIVSNALRLPTPSPPPLRLPPTARSSSTSRKQLASRAPPPRPVNRFANDLDALRFAGILPDGHRLVEAAHGAAARRRQEEEDRQQAAAARAARARAKALAAAEAAAEAVRGAAREEEEEAENRRMAGAGHVRQCTLNPALLVFKRYSTNYVLYYPACSGLVTPLRR